MAHAAGQQQGALVLVRLAVAAAHGVLAGDVGAVRRAHALRPPRLHPAHLPRVALHSLASLCRGEEKKKSTIAVVVTDGVGTIQVDDVAAIHALHNVDSNHRCLLTVSHRGGVSPPGESGQ